jgi:hypothetical protein
MGFFDKVKKFAGGKSMATVTVISINDKAPGEAVFSVSDEGVRGSMKITANQECTMLAAKYEVILRTQDPQGVWGNVIIASGSTPISQDMTPGQEIMHSWRVNDIDLERYLKNQNYTDLKAVVTEPKVKLFINCVADVKGSPFDPDAEVEVRLGAPTAGPVGVKTTVIEGGPAEDASFPVTDSVLKGTVVVTGKSDCVVTATKYEIRLELETPKGLVDVLVAQDQHPKLASKEFSVSFGGTNITFPLKLGKGEKATQTWMVTSIDLAKQLAAHGFNDANAAAADPRVKLVVKCIADVQGVPNAAAARTEIRIT